MDVISQSKILRIYQHAVSEYDRQCTLLKMCFIVSVKNIDKNVILLLHGPSGKVVNVIFDSVTVHWDAAMVLYVL